MNDIDALSRVAELGTVLGVWAHPADEAFSAGLLALARDAGNRVVVVTATRGETGTSDPDCWPPERMSRLRSDELAASLAVLGVDEHRQLDHPDGGCAQVSSELAVGSISKLVKAIRPDTILTFGPDGMTGHADHRAVWRWVCSAWQRAGRSATLLQATCTRAFAEEFAQLNPRLFAPGLPQPTEPAGIALTLNLEGPLLDRKIAAMRAHASQLSALRHAVGAETFSRWWSEEAFRVYTTP